MLNRKPANQILCNKDGINLDSTNLWLDLENLIDLHDRRVFQNKLLTFSIKWIELEYIFLCEISDLKKKHIAFSLLCMAEQNIKIMWYTVWYITITIVFFNHTGLDNVPFLGAYHCDEFLNLCFNISFSRKIFEEKSPILGWLRFRKMELMNFQFKLSLEYWVENLYQLELLRLQVALLNYLLKHTQLSYQCVSRYCWVGKTWKVEED